MVNLSWAYRYCEKITRKEAKNFAFAFIFLSPRKQKAMNAVYAFARLVDDIADDEEVSILKRKESLQLCRFHLKESMEGNPKDPLYRALKHTIQTFEIPLRYFDELIQGMEMDLDFQEPHTFEDLWNYCYHVASVVGLISICIFGYKNTMAIEYAIDMGIALQLTNILRDIQEDGARGRIYLPKEDLKRFGVTKKDLQRGNLSLNFTKFMKFQVERTQHYYKKSLALFPYLHKDAVFCPRTLLEIYYQVLKKIEENKFDVFSERIRLSTSKKLGIAFQMWFKTLYS